MNKANIEASLERLMAQVDYYLHCELDEEYEHARPEVARRQLEAALRRELLCAGAAGMESSAMATSAQLPPEANQIS
jgi:hypothetical protein